MTQPQAPLGCLYGIGVGPGDPELISVKGLRCLQTVPVVAFPAGLNGRPGIAEQIITPWLRPEQTKVALDFPYVQDASQLQTAWQQAATTVWSYLEQGLDLAFACEGDISFYSTFNYLSQALQDHHQAPIVVIPGISSPMAAAAALGLPLTTQRDRLAILPTLYCLDDLHQVLTWADVVVLMKVSSSYAQVWPVLKAQQLLDHSYVIAHASTAQQQIYRNLDQSPQLQLPYFSLLVIRKPPAATLGQGEAQPGLDSSLAAP